MSSSFRARTKTKKLHYTCLNVPVYYPNFYLEPEGTIYFVIRFVRVAQFRRI